jgi:hypothetical protein
MSVKVIAVKTYKKTAARILAGISLRMGDPDIRPAVFSIQETSPRCPAISAKVISIIALILPKF